MSKSAIYTVNTAAPTVAANNIVPLGGTVRRYGCNIRQDGNAISLCGCGYYLVNASITATPSAAGTVTVTAQKDGVEMTGATASTTVAAANTAVNLNITAIVRNICDSSLLSFVLTGEESVVNNIAVTVEKL